MNKLYKNFGFTLIEVLVALAIVGIVMVAVLGSMQGVVSSSINIYDRMIAGWIAVDKVTEYRLSRQFPKIGTESGQIEMVDEQWVYTANIEAVSVSAEILTITVKVASSIEPENALGVARGTLIKPSALNEALPSLKVSQARLNGVNDSGGFTPNTFNSNE